MILLLSETDTLTLCQAVAEEFAAVLKVKRPRVRVARRCKVGDQAHVHIISSRRGRRGTICINLPQVQNLTPNQIRRLMADEVAHLKFRVNHTHNNRRYREAEHTLLRHTVTTLVYRQTQQMQLTEFIMRCSEPYAA